MAFDCKFEGQEVSSQAILFTMLDLVNDIVISWLPSEDSDLQLTFK